MKTFPSIRKNYAFNVLLTFVNLAYPFATLAYLARIIGPGYLGKYYIASSLVAYFLFAASFGIPMYGIREIGRHRGNPEALGRVFSELALLGAASAAAASLIFLATTFSVPEFRQDWPLFLILGLMLPVNAFSVDFLFMGLENQAHVAARSLAVKSLSLALLFCLVRDADDYLWYAAITTGGLLLHNLAALPAAWRLARPRLAGLRPGPHLRPLAFLFLTLVAGNVYLSLDSVVLGILSDERTVGYYNAATRLCRVSVALLSAVGITVIPRLSRFLEEGRDAEYLALLRKTFDLICLLAIPIGLTLGIAAPGIVGLVFGPAFAPAVPALEIAAPLVGIAGLTSFFGTQVLFPKGGEKALFLASLAGAAMSLGLLGLLAPGGRHAGAAWAAVLAETTVLVILWREARARYGIPLGPGGQTWKYLAAGLAMAAVLAAFRMRGPMTPPWLLAALAAAFATYAGLLAALREPLLRELGAALSARLRAVTRP